MVTLTKTPQTTRPVAGPVMTTTTFYAIVNARITTAKGAR